MDDDVKQVVVSDQPANPSPSPISPRPNIFKQLLPVLLLAATLPIIVVATRYQQNLQKKAATPETYPCGYLYPCPTGTPTPTADSRPITATLAINPPDGVSAPNKEVTATIRIASNLPPPISPTRPVPVFPVTTVQFYLNYQYSGTFPELVVLDSDPQTPGTQIKPGTFQFDKIVVNEVKTDTISKTVTIGFAGYNLNGFFVDSQPISVADIHFMGKAPTKTTLFFNLDLSKVVLKSSGDNALSPNLVSKNIFITDTPPTPTPYVTPTPPTCGQEGAGCPVPYNCCSGLVCLTASSSAVGKCVKQTSLPTPTPTPALDRSLILNLAFQGVGPTSYKNPKTVTMDFRTPPDPSGSGIGKTFAFTMYSDNLGVYSYRSFPFDITPGTYDVYIKGPAHLQRRIPKVSAFGNITIDQRQNPLRAGDIAGGPNNSPDNMVDASDLGLLISRFNPTVPLPTNTTWDLNDDKVIDISDLAILISNFKPGIYGEPQ